MRAKFHKLLRTKDASLYNGYHWQYLLDFDSLPIWLNSVRMFPYDEITVDWTNERFDTFLSNALNLSEQKYVPTLRYFINKGGQFLGLLRDFIQNTTQLTHAFLVCRVCDCVCNEMAIANDTPSKTQILYDGDSDSHSDFDGTNNEWLIMASRLLKLKLFAFLLDYNHHSSNFIEGLCLSQTYYMISMKRILGHYYRNGYSLNDIETDLPMSRLLAKYILSEIDIFPHKFKNKKEVSPNESKENPDFEKNTNESLSKNEMFTDILLFVFDIIEFIGKNKTFEWGNIAEYVVLQQKEFGTEFISSVLRNIYFIIRIVPAHIKTEWLILYALFDIYECIVSEEGIQRQLHLLLFG